MSNLSFYAFFASIIDIPHGYNHKLQKILKDFLLNVTRNNMYHSQGLSLAKMLYGVHCVKPFSLLFCYYFGLRLSSKTSP